MAEILSKCGLYLDEIDKLCILEPDVYKQTNSLKDESKTYLGSMNFLYLFLKQTNFSIYSFRTRRISQNNFGLLKSRGETCCKSGKRENASYRRTQYAANHGKAERNQSTGIESMKFVNNN